MHDSRQCGTSIRFSELVSVISAMLCFDNLLAACRNLGGHSDHYLQRSATSLTRTFEALGKMPEGQVHHSAGLLGVNVLNIVNASRVDLQSVACCPALGERAARI